MLGDINLQISQASIFIPNILFGIGMTLAMIPLVSFSCLTVPAKEMSNASGLQNFIKTIGGAVGTSLVVTFISRFSQIHQFMMVKNLSETNSVYIERISAYAANFAQSTDFDTAVNMGVSTVKPLLEACQYNDLQMFFLSRIREYNNRATKYKLQKYLNGWLNRVYACYDFVITL